MKQTKESIISSLDRFRVFGVFTLLQFLLLMGTISAVLTVLYKFFF